MEPTGHEIGPSQTNATVCHWVYAVCAPFQYLEKPKAFVTSFYQGRLQETFESCHNITYRQALFLSHTYTDGRTAPWHVPMSLAFAQIDQ